MATDWGLTVDEICDLALERLNVVGVLRAPSAAQRTRARQALNSILKRMPWYGYAFPELTDGRYPINVLPGPQQTAFPSDLFGAPSLMLMIDEVRDGFDRDDSASSLGETPQGESYTVTSGSTFGVSAGKAYLASGSAGRAMVRGQKNGEVGITLSTFLAADLAHLAFRGEDEDNCLALLFDTAYKLVKYTAGVAEVLKTYSTAPASGDVLTVRAVGASVVPVVNGTALEVCFTEAYLEEELFGFGSGGSTSRFDNLRYSSGATRECRSVTPAKFHSLPNRYETADYPQFFMLGADRQAQFWPVPEYACRGELLYQKKLSDVEEGGDMEMPGEWHWPLSGAVAYEIAEIFGRASMKPQFKADWEEARLMGVFASDNHGDVIFEYPED